MWYPGAIQKQAPANCFTGRRTNKIAVCNHRTVGGTAYLRDFQHLQESPPRLVSTMFLIDPDGIVYQFGDTDFVYWTQGIGPQYYDYARERWPLFADRNPNNDCMGFEHVDLGKPFTSERPMPAPQFEASLKLHQWSYTNIIKSTAKLGRTLISHDILTPNRSQDPGDWFMAEMSEALGATLKAPARHIIHPQLGVVSMNGRTAHQSRRGQTRAYRQALLAKIRSGKRRMTFNDAVDLAIISGAEADRWSARVWHQLRRHGRSPLAPWKRGESLYEAICRTIAGSQKVNASTVNFIVSEIVKGNEDRFPAYRGVMSAERVARKAA